MPGNTGNIYRPNVDYTFSAQVVGDFSKVAFVPYYAMATVSGSTPTAVSAANPLPVTTTSSGTATAGTNLSGTVTTTSGVFNLPALATRKPGDVQGQNIGANNIGFNEFGGTAAIGTAGTYTVIPGATFSITTNQLVNFIAATGSTAVTITSV